MGSSWAKRMNGRRNVNQVQVDDIDSVDGTYYENVDIISSQRFPPDGLNSRDGSIIERQVSDTNEKLAESGNTNCKNIIIESREAPVPHRSSNGWKRTQEAPMERVVFLLEAFMPLIVGCLNVMDILPHLVVIEDTDTLRQKHNESPRKAVTSLIQQLKDSDEPGKWQHFLEALRSAGYHYIARLLLEETEADHTINRGLLRLFTPELINRIDPEEFIDHLLADQVIFDQDKEEIQCEKRNRGDIAASLMLLERIPKKQENWFDIFVRVLEKCGLEDLIHCFRESDSTMEKTNEWTSHHQNKSKPDTHYMDYTQPSWTSHQQNQSKPDTDCMYYIPPSYEYIPSKSVPNIHEQKAILDQLSKQHEAWRVAVETRKEICNLEAGIRRYKLEWENLIKADERGVMEQDIPKEQHKCDTQTFYSATSNSPTLSEPNTDIDVIEDVCTQMSIAKRDHRQGEIVNGIHSKDIPCELKGNHEQYIMPAYVKLKKQPNIKTEIRMDSAKSMPDISSYTEQYV